MKIGYLAAILKRYKYFIFFPLKYGCDQCIYIWCKDNLKIPVGKWFSLRGGGVPWNTPLCTNGSAGYLMQLSVKMLLRLVGQSVLELLIKTIFAYNLLQDNHKLLFFKRVLIILRQRTKHANFLRFGLGCSSALLKLLHAVIFKIDSRVQGQFDKPGKKLN